MAVEKRTVKSGAQGSDVDVGGDVLPGGEIIQYFKLLDATDNSDTRIGTTSNPLPVNDADAEALLTRIAAGDSGSQNTVNITTGAGGTQILAAASTRKSVMLENRGTAYVDVGLGGSITAGHGIRLFPGDRMWIDGSPNAEIRAIASTGTQAVSYLVESE